MSYPQPEEIRDENKMIRIRSVRGGRDRSDLVDCFFYPTTSHGVYVFCNRQGEELAVNITSRTPFHFDLAGHRGRVPDPLPGSEPFTIDDRAARGSWRNDAPGRSAEEGGTFTAQVSGGVEVEANASPATA